jgi:glutamate racemase
MKLLIKYIQLTILLFGLNEVVFSQLQSDYNLDNLNKKKITIVITDSGLGGMSVVAGIEEKLKIYSSFEEVELIFFNALPKKGIGYNTMKSAEKKASVFNEALEAMAAKYSPDLILIACNTLSVVYPLTQFYKESKTPVLGIVDFGVEMIRAELKNNPDANVILLGTETTIESNSHKNKLIANGIKEEKIIPQACPGLESEIQNEPESFTTLSMIEMYTDDALSKIEYSKQPIITGLCCTHYGFVSDEIFASLKKQTSSEVKVLNPNEAMINAIVNYKKENPVDKVKIVVRVLSQAELTENEQESIGLIIEKNAPLSAKALRNYEYIKNLFNYSIE